MQPARLVVMSMLVLLGAGSTASAFEDQDIIDYREHIMVTLDEQTAALGMLMATQIPPDNLAAHAEAIALTAKQALKSFEPKVQGGESKPLVWEQWADFSERMNSFAKKTEALAVTARTKGQDAMMTEVVDALSCKGCHDVYRNKK